jgi:hypothetical protein
LHASFEERNSGTLFSPPHMGSSNGGPSFGS